MERGQEDQVDGRADRCLDACPLPIQQLISTSPVPAIRARSVTSALLAPLLILLLGAALRLPLASRDVRLQSDEALYATYARHISATGDLLLIGINNLDKPPLLIWAISGSFDLFGVNEFAARLPNLAACLISLALIYALARQLYADQRTACIAALLLAVSPYDRALAATAFLDPLTTMFILAGCLLATHRRWLMVGIALAAGFAVKENALQWIPLAILLGVIYEDSAWRAARSGLLILTAFAVATSPLILWSVARDTTPDFWTLNAYNNAPGRMSRSDELLPRLTIWLGWLNTITPLPMLSLFAVPINWFKLRGKAQQSRTLTTDLLLTAYSLASFWLLWLVAFNTYDRYVHTLVPFLLILYARVVIMVGDQLRISFAIIGLFALFAPLLFVSLLPVGGDPRAVAGIDRIADAINTLPSGSAIYEHSLGWELTYYLGTQPRNALVWEPSIDSLITALKHQPGYWVAPISEARTWDYLLQAAGLTVQPIIVDGAPNFELSFVTPKNR